MKQLAIVFLLVLSGCAGQRIPEFYAHRNSEKIPAEILSSWRIAQLDMVGLVGACAFSVDPADFHWIAQTRAFDCLGEGPARGCFIPGHTILFMRYADTVRHEARHAIAYRCHAPTWATVGHEGIS